VKAKRFIILGVVAVLAAAYIISIIPNFRHRAEWKRTVAALQALSREKVQSAARAFARDRKIGNGAVSLRDLLSGGYLRPEDLRGLEEKDATISVTADETTPSAVWIRVRASDGSDIGYMADGSIQRIARR
jgi:hypothetical protein